MSKEEVIEFPEEINTESIIIFKLYKGAIKI